MPERYKHTLTVNNGSVLVRFYCGFSLLLFMFSFTERDISPIPFRKVESSVTVRFCTKAYISIKQLKHTDTFTPCALTVQGLCVV